MKTKESRKHLFAVGMAALGLAVVTLFTGCQIETEGGVDPVESRAVSAAIDLTGTTWFADVMDPSGVSRIDFTSATAATGVFGNTDHVFTYTINSSGTAGTLTETSTAYSWVFNIDAGVKLISFTGGLPPYSTATTVNFRRITIQTNVPLADLTDTLWIGRGPRGESYLYNFSFVSGNTWNLTGAFGPDAPNPFTMTYDYDSATGTGSGTMSDGAGDFTTDAASDTMVFPDFWGHIEEVTFNLFKFVQ